MRLKSLSWLLAAGSLTALAGCSQTGDTASTPSTQASAPQRITSGQPPRGQCQAEAAQSLVGQPYGADTLARALAAAGADEARMLTPNSMITKEYLRGRLNVEVDAAGRVAGVRCG